MATMKKTVSMLLFLMVLAVSAFSLDFKSFPSPIQKGSLLISGGFGLGSLYPAIPFVDRSVLLGGAVSLDYALPINFALTGC
jgi:hypothetical protein